MMKKTLLLLFMAGMIISCSGGKKQGLEDKPKAESEENTLRKVYESEEVMDTVIPAKGVKYKGTRKVDAANPPIKLNLARTDKENKNLDVADFYSKARYVKLKHPLPSEEGGFLGDAFVSITLDRGAHMMGGINSNIFLSKDKIIAGDDFFGYYCYNKDGKFESVIISREVQPHYNKQKNELTLDFSKSSESIMSLSVLDNNCFYYVVKNNKPRMYFHNLESKKNYLERPGWYGHANLYSPTTIVSYTYNPRNPNTAPVFMLYDYKGDTLSMFMNNNPLITPQNKSNTNPDRQFVYYYNNQLSMRQAYNDTVYRVVSEKELKPVYVMDFGNRKLDPETGFYGDKTNKLIPYGWVETSDFVFATYTENYDCPNNRNNRTVKFNYNYYDKKSKTLYNMPSDKFPEEFLISNSIEGGIPLIGNNLKANGEQLYIGYTKPQLESIISHSDFSSLPQSQQDKLKSLNEDLGSQEMLVMILEK